MTWRALRSLCFTVVVKSASSHSRGWREHVGKNILGQGALSFASPATVLTGPSLAHGPLGGCLPRTLMSLTTIAACDALADMPAGTASITAAAEAIETALGSAFVVRSRAEPAVARWAQWKGRVVAQPSAANGCEAAAGWLGPVGRWPTVIPRPAAAQGPRL